MTRIRRSILFVPADKPERIEKAATLSTDVVVIELEDGVSPENKDSARREAGRMIEQVDFGNKEVALRVNRISTLHGLEDMKAMAKWAKKPDLVLLPKVESAGEVRIYDDLISEMKAVLEFMVMIESSRGILNAAKIVSASPRVSCLALGTADLSAELGAHHDETCFLYNPYENRKELVEALFWYPMFRTWFSLCGLCKIVYNDIVPPDNQETEDPRKIIDHVIGYANYFSGVTGIEVNVDDLIEMSERVYNFQRIFNLRQGYGVRDYDKIPYRAMGPVTEEEYLSRQEEYDEQLTSYNVDSVARLDNNEKLKKLREYREERYNKFRDEIYKRRGWNSNGIPTIETVKRLQIDFPEIVDLINIHSKEAT